MTTEGKLKKKRIRFIAKRNVFTRAYKKESRKRASVNKLVLSQRKILRLIKNNEIKNLCEHLQRKGVVPIDKRYIDYKIVRIAVRANNEEIVRRLIRRGFRVNIDTCPELSDTPLHLAVENNSEIMVKTLLSCGARIDCKNEREVTPLQLALNLGHFKLFDIMLGKLYNTYIPNLIAAGIMTRLHEATLRCDVSAVKRMIQNPRVNVLENVSQSSPILPGYTALHLAIIMRCKESCELILRKIAKVNMLKNLDKQFYELVEATDNLAIVKLFLEQHMYPINTAMPINSGLRHLHVACESEHVPASFVEMLLKAGANVHATTHHAYTWPGYSALHFAVLRQRVDKVKLLLAHGADICQKNDFGETPLHLGHGSPQLVQICMSQYKCYNIDTADVYGISHFHLACFNNVYNVVVEFLYRGVVDINAPDRYGNTVLHTMAQGCVNAVLNLLLDNDANVFAQNENGSTPIHLASGKTLDRLLRYVKDFTVNPTDRNGVTVLDKACQRYRGYGQHVIEKYIRCGIVGRKTLIDAMRRSIEIGEDGTLLHLAAKGNNVETAALLLQQRVVDVDALDADGNTALHVVSMNDEVNDAGWEVAHLLISNGADVNARTSLREDTPLHLATEHDQSEILSLLLSTGANVGAVNLEGKTPMRVAREKCYWDCYHQLREKLLRDELH